MGGIFLGLNTYGTLINKGLKGDCTKLNFTDSEEIKKRKNYDK